MKTYIGSLASLASALLASWVYWYGVDIELRFALGTVIFGGLLCVITLYPIKISERCEINALDIGLVASIVILGPFWAAISSLPCAVLIARKDWLRTAYEATRNTIEVYLAGMVFYSVSGPLLTGRPELVVPVVYATLASGATLLIVNYVVDAGLVKVKYDQGFGETWRKQAEPYLVSDLISILTVGLAVLALMVYGPVAAIVVVGGAIGSQVLVYRSRDKAEENQELRERIRSLEESLTISNTTFGMMMIRDLGQKDGYTHWHAAATAVFAADLAREMKLDDLCAGRLRMAGLLHNIGLFSLPKELLVATGRLNSVAQSEFADHPVRGEEALAAVPELKEMAGWVRWHHERVDGRGYPDKLRGPWIPLESKILALSQAYAAMVLDQPRRPGMSFAEAREALISGIDTQFDGVVVRAMLRVLDTESEGYRMADDHRFIFPDPKHVASVQHQFEALESLSESKSSLS